MKLFIASDHAGYADKQLLVSELGDEFDVEDLGPTTYDPADDYPVYAQKVATATVANPGSFGILLCRSGEGMEIAANKVDGARAALVWNEALARETRSDNDSNILVLPAGEVDFEMMQRIALAFIQAKFSGEQRHKRRLDEIAQLEEGEKLDG
ncbi:RpiB/LacA/LacB family sugar-phosphate isomerase [bacterium]|nr:RpiB/LacA/LacB family sugar-phosphate isomerase [bacterium]